MTFRPAGTENVLFCETETRLEDYDVYLLATNRKWDRKPSFAMKPSHPLLNVTWKECQEFCEWLTDRDRKNKIIPDKARYRLPSDAEWSAAVGLTSERGSNPLEKNMGNKADFPWGKEWPPPIISANLNTARMEGYQDSYSYTAPVGSFSPNSYHLFDLAGNVAEWCEDAWPDASGERVVRGGSWLSFARDSLLSSARQHLPESAIKTDVGFRCVLELPSP
jgi:formylglycine-generating enzyme required for sulfatase activity